MRYICYCISKEPKSGAFAAARESARNCCSAGATPDRQPINDSEKILETRGFLRFRGISRDGCNAIMGPISQTPLALNAVKHAEEKLGQKIIIIDTPWINVDDNAEARRDAEQIFRHASDVGCTFSLMHHSSVEQLVNKNKRIIDRLPDYLYMVRESGQIPGLSAHMPEIVTYCDANGYDVETYIQIFNCMGFLMQVEARSSQAL